MTRQLGNVLPLFVAFVLAVSHAQASLIVLTLTVALEPQSLQLVSGCESAVPCSGIAASDCGHRRIHQRHGHVRCPQGLNLPFNVV